MGRDFQVKQDQWVVRDDAGLLHVASVRRAFDGSVLAYFEVATACSPRPRQTVNNHDLDWGSAIDLPKVRLEGFVVVEWRLREIPTCLRCIVLSDGFTSFPP